MHFSWIIRVNRPHLFENLHIVCFEIHSFGTRALFQQFRTVLLATILSPKKRAPLFQGRVARGTNPFHAAREQLAPKPRLGCL